MNGSQITYDTGVEASNAVLSARPAFWSYTTLKEVETCPRRYSLGRASYPDLWGQAGYPPLPTTSALFGDVVHGAVEAIVSSLAAAGYESVRSTGAVGLLRVLGGYSAIAEGVMVERLARLEANPRLDEDSQRRLRRDLSSRTAEVRVQVQAFVGRTTISSRIDGRKTPGNPATGNWPAKAAWNKRLSLRLGTRAEVKLVAEHLRLGGQADLISVGAAAGDITDYKTGKDDPTHLEQLSFYALLWTLD